MEAERRLVAAGDDVADDSPTYAARVRRGSYVSFGRFLPSADRDLGDQNDEKMSPFQQQKRSKAYLFLVSMLNEDPG